MAALLRVPIIRFPRRIGSELRGISKLPLLTKWQGRFLAASTSCKGEEAVGNTPPSFLQHRDGVEVNWKLTQQQLGSRSKFHYVWLRDNCMCPQCFHPETSQRLVNALQVPLDVSPSRVEFTTKSNALRVEWKDGHISEYSMAWLRKNSYEHERDGNHPAPRFESDRDDTNDNISVWGKEIASNPPLVEFAKVMQDDRECLECLKLVKKYGFCFIHGTPVSVEESHKLMSSMFGVIRNTFYGPFWEFTSTMESSTRDTAYTSLAIESHTDGNYFSEAPGLEVFHCVQFEGSGGQSILVDGFKVAEEIRSTNPEYFKILSTVPFSFHYTDSEREYINSNTCFTIDSETGKVTSVHFNESDRLPLNSTHVDYLRRLGIGSKDSGVSPMMKLYEALQGFITSTRDESLMYRFQLEPGKLLLFNNHRLLHARTSFTGVRKLCGCYVNMEEYDSKLHMLRSRYSIQD